MTSKRHLNAPALKKKSVILHHYAHNGQAFQSGHLNKNGEPVLTTWHHENGAIETHYEDYLSGYTRITHFNENGQLLSKHYEHGTQRPIGPQTLYHENGNLKFKGLRTNQGTYYGFVIRGREDGTQERSIADGHGNERPYNPYKDRAIKKETQGLIDHFVMNIVQPHRQEKRISVANAIRSELLPPKIVFKSPPPGL